MLKVLRAEYRGARVIRVTLSDGTGGDCDLQELIDRGGEMVAPLADRHLFQSFFLELGALCWPNGFELSATGIRQRLNEQGALWSMPPSTARPAP